jgi:hypothetical protein
MEGYALGGFLSQDANHFFFMPEKRVSKLGNQNSFRSEVSKLIAFHP